MNKRSNILEIIIPKANAQQADTLVQPTFGRIDIGGGSQTNASILLSANQSEVDIGDTILFTVEVQTNTIQIDEYVITVEFEPNFFSPVDADPNTSGIQVTHIEDVFVTQENIVSNNGLIRFGAASPGEQSLALNTQVIQFELQAIDIGESVVSIVTEGTSGSRLVRANAVSSVDYSANEIRIELVDESDGDGGGTDGEDGDNEEQPSEPGDGGVVTPIPPVDPDVSEGGDDGVVTPKTSIGSDLPLFAGTTLAIILIIIGLSLKASQRKAEKEH